MHFEAHTSVKFWGGIRQCHTRWAIFQGVFTSTCFPPGNRQSAHSVNTSPFIQPPMLSTPSAAATIPLSPRRLQVDNSRFRDGIFARLLMLLEEIKDTKRVHGRLIQTLLLQRDALAVSVLPEGTVFPLKTVLDIQNMEQKLADPTFLKEVVSMRENSFALECVRFYNYVIL